MGDHAHTRDCGDGQCSLSYWIEQDAAAPGLARREAREFLAPRLDERELDDVLLGVSELVTNATKFGSGEPLWLHVLASPHRLVVTVTSGGSNGLADKLAGGWAANPVSFVSQSGRGLGIVLDLFDDVAVSCGRVTVVRAAKQLGGTSRPPSPLRIGDSNFAFVRR